MDLGVPLKYYPSWTLIAGIGYYQPRDYITTGILTQGADANSASTYGYSYQTQSQQILVEGRALLVTQGQIQPFLMLGLGAAVNKVSQFKNGVPIFYEFTPSFSAHTKTNFTYSIGPGVELSVTRAFHIGISYRFTDLGSIRTGSGQMDGIAFGEHLRQGHLYANQILAQFTFIPWNS